MDYTIDSNTNTITIYDQENNGTIRLDVYTKR